MGQLVVFSFGESSREESISKVIQVVVRIHLISVSLWAPGFCWMLAGDCPQVLQDVQATHSFWRLLPAPSHMGFSDMTPYFTELTKTLAPVCQDTVLIKCSIIIRVTFHYICHILLVRSKSQSPFSGPIQEEGFYRTINMMRWESLGFTVGICIWT